MIRLDLTRAVLDSPDLPNITAWLRRHEIDVEWMPLQQTLEFDVGFIWYDLYQHTMNGSLIYRDNEVDRRRVKHTCTLKCRGSVPERLIEFRMETTDAAPAAEDV